MSQTIAPIAPTRALPSKPGPLIAPKDRIGRPRRRAQPQQPEATPAPRKMGYLELLNRFWQLNEHQAFTPAEHQLYFWWLNQFNTGDATGPWPESLARRVTEVCAALTLSDKTVTTALAGLAQRALLSYEPGDRRHSGIFRMHYQPITSETKRPTEPASSSWPTGQVYLMRHGRNGYVKIGYSTQPTIREHTLQSEDPDIALLAHWPGTFADEKALHRQFAAQRLRGEWFNLTPADLAGLLP